MKIKQILVYVVCATVMFCCTSKKQYSSTDMTPAVIDRSSDTDYQNSVHLFSELHSKVPCIGTVNEFKKLDANLRKKENLSLFHLGISNCFFMEIKDELFLCISKNAVDKKSKDPTGIVTIPYGTIQSQAAMLPELSIAYSPREEYCDSLKNNDYVCIKGYLPKRTGEVTNLKISGHIKKISDDEVILFLDPDVNLAGFIGAPAFNEKGQIIGIYTGRLAVKDAKYSYAKITLFSLVLKNKNLPQT